MQWLHRHKEYKPELLEQPEARAAIEETNRILSQPLKNISISQEIPAELTAALEQNTFIFSGFKTHHQLVEASKLLKDNNGNFKPFQRFLKDVETLDKTYNQHYLRAEYNYATASTQMAVKWKQWEQDGDTYNLQYRTAGDHRVRREHAALHGVTLPPSDPFWDKFLPPNGWNCRCTTIQVRKDKYKVSNSEKAIAAGNACTAKPKQQIFRFNPGKAMKVFPPKHPYLPKGCSNCEFKQLIFDNDKAICKACRMVDANSVKWSRDMVRAHYKKYIGNRQKVVWKVNNGIDELILTYQDIKSITGKSHKYPYARNLATYYIRTLIKQAKYLGYSNDFKGDNVKGHADTTIWHYFKIPFMKQTSYLIIKEKNGEKFIHHIQDDEHFKESLIKHKAK